MPKTKEQEEEVVRKSDHSNSEETNTHAPLTPTASDDNLSSTTILPLAV